MNSNKRVFALVSICFIIFFVFSFLSSAFKLNTLAFDKVNLLNDLFPKKLPSSVIPSGIINQDLSEKTKDQLANINNEAIDFELYKKGDLITNFKQTTQPSLPHLIEKLFRLKKGEAVKIRIAYFGDSMIESDLLTQTLRKLLQQHYGGVGVGYLPLSSNVAEFRHTASVKGTGWEDQHLKTSGVTNVYLSGHSFLGKGEGIYTDHTYPKDNIKNVQKALLFGKTNGVEVSVNNQTVTLKGNQLVNRLILNDNVDSAIQIKSNCTVPLYGITFESEQGVFVDNFSFRGITGIEYKCLQDDYIKAIQATNEYDLVVLQYGVNMMFRPNDTDYTYYQKMFSPVLSKFKTAFSNADILLIGAADRAFRYDGVYKTAIGLPNLVQLQAQMAFDNGFAFFNLFQTMGGENSIVRWAEQQPSLANKDYIHPNGRGANILGEKIFEAIQKEFNKYSHH